MKKALLIILDGVGVRSDDDFNAIAHAKTPNLSHYMQNYAFVTINASEEFVGLPKGQFGNSEVGHLNLGAGRIVRQDISKIDHAIETREFFNNDALVKACQEARFGTIHIMGLLSDGGVHAHQNHIYALIKLASSFEHITQIWVHAFLDGRDTPPQSALKYVAELDKQLQSYPKAKLATISGRFYAMDRDKRYERVVLAYQAIANGIGDKEYSSAEAAINASYQQQIFDEFIKPAIFNNYSGVVDGDSIIFANFRADRAIQLTDAFVSEDFSGFAQKKLQLGAFLTMTRYSDKFESLVAFPASLIENTLGEYISSLGLKQLRIGETEKYPHITYFFNGGKQEAFPYETRQLINSPKDVATYDLKPEMSLPEVASQLIDAINSQKYDLIITNFANGDMVGHSGNYPASIKAVEALDKYVGEVVTNMLNQGGEVLIVADHGNCEEMFDYVSNQPHTQHTTNLVPCIYIGRNASLRASGGALQDVAPLAMMGLDKPSEMTGESLINFI